MYDIITDIKNKIRISELLSQCTDDFFYGEIFSKSGGVNLDCNISNKNLQNAIYSIKK